MNQGQTIFQQLISLIRPAGESVKSVLLQVFANLLRSGRLSEDDLRGLDPAKLDAIRYMASY
jgi:hypothetical protein